MNTGATKSSDARMNDGEFHTFHLEQRRKAVITGITDICSFHENEIVLRLRDSQMVLSGHELHLGKLLLDEGRVDVEGQIDGVVYEMPRMSAKRMWPRKKTEK